MPSGTNSAYTAESLLAAFFTTTRYTGPLLVTCFVIRDANWSVISWLLASYRNDRATPITANIYNIFTIAEIYTSKRHAITRYIKIHNVTVLRNVDYHIKFKNNI